MFKPLSKENIGGIVDLLVGELNERLVDKELKIVLSDSAKQHVINEAYDPVYGARPLKRYLQKHVETLVARMILSDEVNMGDTIELTVQDGELIGNCR